MKSIGTRIAAWYATAATATLACLFIVGYLLLEKQLVHGLDLLIDAEFRAIETRLGPDYRTLSPQSIETRIRELTDYASTLFYIDMHVRGEGVIFRSTNLVGHDIPDVPGERSYTVEIADIGEVRAKEFLKMPFEVTVATPLRPLRDVMDSYIKVCVLLLAAMVIASLVIGLGLARFVLWPVRLIRDTAIRIGHDNLSERIRVPDVHDEIADLARLLNEMFDRLEVSFHQVRRFTSDASHELKIPLSLISLHAEKMLVDGSLPPAQREEVQVQVEEIARLNQIIDELLFLSRADARAVKLDPKLLPAQAALGRAHLEIGEAAQAIPHLEAALPTDTDGSVHYQLARAYRATGETDRASQALSKFQEIQASAEAEARSLKEEFRIAPP